MRLRECIADLARGCFNE